MNKRNHKPDLRFAKYEPKSVHYNEENKKFSNLLIVIGCYCLIVIGFYFFAKWLIEMV